MTTTCLSLLPAVEACVSLSCLFVLLGKGFPFCSQCWFCLSSCPHFTISLRLLHVQIYSYHHWPGDWHCQTLPCDLMSNKSLLTEEAAMNLVQITCFLTRYLSDFSKACGLESQVPPIHISIAPKWELVALLCNMRQDSLFALVSVISVFLQYTTDWHFKILFYCLFFF